MCDVGRGWISGCFGPLDSPGYCRCLGCSEVSLRPQCYYSNLSLEVRRSNNPGRSNSASWRLVSATATLTHALPRPRMQSVEALLTALNPAEH